MFCLLCIIIIIALSMLSEFIYYSTKFNSKICKYVAYLIIIFEIVLCSYFYYKEERTLIQYVYGCGWFVFLFQFIEWIVNDIRNKGSIRLVNPKRFFIFSTYNVEKRSNEHIKKINMVFEVLNEVDSFGTIFVLNDDSNEKTTKILMLIKHADQVSKIKDVCDMVGECEFCRENEERKRCSIMLVIKCEVE